jgi:hypothetical protein
MGRLGSCGCLLAIAALVGCNRALSLPQPDSGGADLASAAVDGAVPPDLAIAHDFSRRPDRSVEPDLGALDLAEVDQSRPLDLPPPLPFDDVCTPGPMGTGVYDPDCVYLLGTLSEGSCPGDVFVHPSRPDDYVAGFPTCTQGGAIRPSDGRLLYVDGVGLESVAMEFAVDAVSPFSTYVADPAANDTAIPTPLCTDGPWRVGSFRDGTILYLCVNSGSVVRSGDTTLLSSDDAIAFGAGRAILVDGGFARLAIVEAGQRTAVTGLPSTLNEVVTARSTADGFLVATYDRDLSTYRLFAIDRAGAATARGNYQMAGGTRCVLEPSGALVCFTEGPGSFHDTITRFTTTGAPTVIYDEQLHLVKIHGSYLVTGP